jgi:hypothetical protein
MIFLIVHTAGMNVNVCVWDYQNPAHILYEKEILKTFIYPHREGVRL